jgi:hypothetical protein
MEDSVTSPGRDARGPGLIRRLGWGHSGFRVQSQRRALAGLLLLLALPFLADQVAFQIRMRDFNPDLRGWLRTATDAAADPGRVEYTPYTGFYIYPPFFLTLIWPLTKLPVPAAAALFETGKWVALVLSLRLAWRLCSRPGEDVPPIVALGSLLLTWRFLDNDLGYGNVNIPLLSLVLLSGWLLCRGRPFTAGLAVAVAASIKVTPALLLVYFAYKGWWRAVLGGLIGVAVCLFLWPALFFGWAGNWQLLVRWYEAVVSGFLAQGAVRSEHTNQALVGILNRLLGTHVAIFPDTYLTIVDLSQPARDAVRLLLSAGVLAALGWACRRRFDVRQQPVTLATEVSLVLIAMLLLSGLAWKSHFVVLLLPYATLLAYLADARYERRGRQVIGVLSLVSFALCSLTGDLITPRGANYAEALGLITLGALAAAAALGVVRALSSPRRGAS